VLVKAGQMTSVRSGDNSGRCRHSRRRSIYYGFQQGHGSRTPAGVSGAGPHLGVWGRSESSRELSELVLGIGLPRGNAPRGLDVAQIIRRPADSLAVQTRPITDEFSFDCDEQQGFLFY